MTDVQTLLRDPEWLCHRYVESEDAFRFIRLPRTGHAGIPFLTDDYLKQAAPGGDVPAATCLSLPEGGPLHYLFHSAFCGSTMLVRALDQPGIAMGMSEPVVLNDIVGFRRRGADPQAVARAADAAGRLLARPFGAGEAVIVKPSNVLNPVAQMLMVLRPGARAVFLHAPLETFLVSVARKGLHCRIWARQLLEGYLIDGAVAGLGFAEGDFFRMSDLQVAAVGWLAQHRLFSVLTERLGGGRIASLNADVMLADPARAIAAVARHYQLDIDATQAARIAKGTAFSRHSKSGADYSPGQREADYSVVRAAHGEEIGMVATWIGAVAAEAGVSMAAPAPLIGP